MTEFISKLIGNDYVATLIMSLIPMIELKGGIVFAWEKFGFLISFALAYIGSTIVFIPIYFLLRPILNLLKKIKFVDKLAFKVENYFKVKAEDTLKKQSQKNAGKPLSETLLKQIGVFIFVAIPLPMTGVWTGTAIAIFLNLKFRHAVLPIVLGNFIAGLLISGLSALCGVIGISLDLVLLILFALALILLIVVIIKVAMQKPKTDMDENKE